MKGNKISQQINKNKNKNEGKLGSFDEYEVDKKCLLI